MRTPLYSAMKAPRRPDLRVRTGGVSLKRRDSVTKRVVVFIDYQNVYRSARETFHSSPAHTGLARSTQELWGVSS